MSTISRILLFSMLLCAAPQLNAQTVRFDFGSGPAADGYTAVTAQTLYSDALGLHEHGNADRQYFAIDLVYKKIQ